MSSGITLLLTAFLLATTPAGGNDPKKPADRAVEKPIPATKEPGDETLPRLLSDAGRATKRGFLVLGRVSLSPDQLRDLRGKPVAEAMREIATAAKGRWEREGPFYVLAPEDMLQHTARPQPLEEKRAAVRKPFFCRYEATLQRVLLQLGRDVGVLMVPNVLGTKPAEGNRSLLPCVLVSSGQTPEEITRACTAATGDPWKRYQLANLLCFTGEAPGTEYHQRLNGMIESIRLVSSLTPAQQQLLQSEEGMSVDQLQPQQRQWLFSRLLTALPDLRGTDPAQLRLRRAASDSPVATAGLRVVLLGQDRPREVFSITSP